MCRRNVHNFTIREYLSHPVFKLLPLVAAMKIIDQQEATAQQIFTHRVSFAVAERSKPGLDDIQQREVEDIFIKQGYRLTLVIGIQMSKSFQRCDEMWL